jgi:hypothetical protein
MALDQNVFFQPGALRNDLSVRVMRTASIRGKPQTMIGTDDLIAGDLALVQRRETMRAPSGKGNRPALIRAIYNDIVSDDPTTQGTVFKISTPARAVPAISYETGHHVSFVAYRASGRQSKHLRDFLVFLAEHILVPHKFHILMALSINISPMKVVWAHFCPSGRESAAINGLVAVTVCERGLDRLHTLHGAAREAAFCGFCLVIDNISEVEVYGVSKETTFRTSNL